MGWGADDTALSFVSGPGKALGLGSSMAMRKRASRQAVWEHGSLLPVEPP